MAVPPYPDFIEPILRFLARREEGASADDVREESARALGLSGEDQEERHKSGAVVYRSRAGWAFDRLKRSGFAETSESGMWRLTEQGRELAKRNASLSKEVVSQIAATKTARNKQKSKKKLQVAPPPALATAKRPAGDRKAYRLPPRPVATGGQADVFKAVRKSDSRVFIFKRATGKAHPKRMKREIEIQSSMEHPNIMPILDWDVAKFRWYVMPLGSRTLLDLERPIDAVLLCDILGAVLNALEFAHQEGHPHRDIKPDNIIELVENGVARWVVADWGLTRRPLGETTSPLTNTGHLLGTAGFAPPEAYRDGHTVGEPGDIYSLGQLVAWATGSTPVPNVQPTVAEPWSELVERMTRLEATKRLQTVAEVRAGLQMICDSRAGDPVTEPIP